ncbi:MAG: phosphotransferase [Anaerolineae bacterium]
MAASILDTLAVLEPSPADFRRLGLATGSLTLRRAWPRSPHHVVLEYVAGNGQTVVGQWFDDAGDLQRIARATTANCTTPGITVVTIDEAGVLLQAGGADRRLPGLAPLVARPGARLLVHRPERRAVVRLQGSNGPCYAKVVRPDRVRSLVAAGQAAQRLADGAFAAPELLDADLDLGVAIWSALPGVSLYDLLQAARAPLPAGTARDASPAHQQNGRSTETSHSVTLIRAARATGEALRALHSATPPAHAGMHRAAEEIGVLQRWGKLLRAFAPDVYDEWRAAATSVFETLTADRSPLVLLHRDIYDKQVFINGHERIGLLDFDTLAVGEAALDLANALVHLELRALQDHCSPEQAARVATALVEGYRPQPHVYRRLPVYADATRLRLACVYTFRPRQALVVPKLLALVGRPKLFHTSTLLS